MVCSMVQTSSRGRALLLVLAPAVTEAVHPARGALAAGRRIVLGGVDRG